MAAREEWERDRVKKLQVKITLSGPTATELRRVCDNLDILPSLFAKWAVQEKLERMGIPVK